MSEYSLRLHSTKYSHILFLPPAARLISLIIQVSVVSTNFTRTFLFQNSSAYLLFRTFMRVTFNRNTCCFVPLAINGWVRSLDEAYLIYKCTIIFDTNLNLRSDN